MTEHNGTGHDNLYDARDFPPITEVDFTIGIPDSVQTVQELEERFRAVFEASLPALMETWLHSRAVKKSHGN